MMKKQIMISILAVALLACCTPAGADEFYTAAASGNPTPDAGTKPFSTSHWEWSDGAEVFQLGDATAKIDERRLEVFASSNQGGLRGNPLGATAVSEIVIPLRMNSAGTISFRLNAVGTCIGGNPLWQVTADLTSAELGSVWGVNYGSEGSAIVDLHETLIPVDSLGHPWSFSADDTLSLRLFLRADSLIVGSGLSTCNFSGDNPQQGAWVDNFQNFSPTPEPATLTLLGLGGLALIRRRRICPSGRPVHQK